MHSHEPSGCPIIGCDWQRAAARFFPPQFDSVIWSLFQHSFAKVDRAALYSAPGRDLIVEETGLSSATVTRRISAMRAAGWIRYAHSGSADNPAWYELRIPDRTA